LPGSALLAGPAAIDPFGGGNDGGDVTVAVVSGAGHFDGGDIGVMFPVLSIARSTPSSVRSFTPFSHSVVLGSGGRSTVANPSRFGS
jgi:hypothetical protein